MFGMFGSLTNEQKVEYLQKKVSDLLTQMENKDISYKRKIFELEEEIKSIEKKYKSFYVGVNEFIDLSEKTVDSLVKKVKDLQLKLIDKEKK